MSQVKIILVRFTLLLVSTLLGILIAEVSLRIFYPKYEYAAESHYNYSDMRIWTREEGDQYRRRHPDSGNYHTVYHNNFALRQHRTFSEVDITSSVNIGFFGDSFVENLRLPSPYSFTEPLDYLLNVDGERYNVLNFGVDGYGTGQSFLHYQDFKYSDELDYVFYVFMSNDLRNIYENNIYSIDRKGHLVRKTSKQSPLWIRLASRLHITYLMMDVAQRIVLSRERKLPNLAKYIDNENLQSQQEDRFHSPRADSISRSFEGGYNTESLSRSIEIFRSLLIEWRESVEMNGGKFYIVTLPMKSQNRIHDLISGNFNTVDLHKCFSDMISDYKYSHVRFSNDGHWDERGNFMAALCFYNKLSESSDIEAIEEDRMENEVCRYYASFQNGWMPDGEWSKRCHKPPERADQIRNKYLKVEIQSQ